MTRFESGNENSTNRLATSETSTNLLADTDPPFIKAAAKEGAQTWMKDNDTNKDGKVTFDEYLKVHAPDVAKQRDEYAAHVARVKIAETDKNGDNKISLSELKTEAGAESASYLMKEFDKNKDGFLDFNEAKNIFASRFHNDKTAILQNQFDELDGSADGKVSTAEVTTSITDALRRGLGFPSASAGSDASGPVLPRYSPASEPWHLIQGTTPRSQR